jgi:PAS domain S-box-containing protein
MPQKRLLVVDDDESNRDMFGRRLFRVGYDVRLASSGREALEVLEREKVDLVLLDLTMPELSGFDVLRQIRLAHPASELPVIIVTADHDSEGLVAALRAGANDYITKPVDFAVAQARIETRLTLAATSREKVRQMELYRLASVACDEGLWDWNLSTSAIEYSPRWKRMLGFTDQEISCSPEEWFTRIHPDDVRRVKREIRAYLMGETEYLYTQYRMRHKNGSWRWLENRGSMARDESGCPARLAGAHTDITSRKTIDPLTSLANRVWLQDEFHNLEEEGQPAALLLFVLDAFERVEESLPDGGAGPLLAVLAGRLRAALNAMPERDDATPVRPADHEFAVLLRGSRSREELERVASSLQSVLNQPAEMDGHTVYAGACVGIATTCRGEPPHALLFNAHAAMRHAREQGVPGAELFHSGMREKAIEELRIEADLRRSLEEQAFIVHYQPKVSLRDGAILGFEALLRWRRSQAGLVQPENFIPLAERTGMIVAIGKQVLERACMDAADLRRQFPNVTVSVNVSGQQFADPRLVEYVGHSLEISGLAPAALRLEITETAVMRNPEAALEMLQRLRRMGVGLKLDDFGTGYSSLMYLHRFPVDTLKIDRSFVMRLPAAPEALAIIRAILTLARSLQMDVVAEGVETRRQAEMLYHMGCEYAQGYWYSRAVEISVLRELLAGGRLPVSDRKPQAGSTVTDRVIA